MLDDSLKKSKLKLYMRLNVCLMKVLRKIKVFFLSKLNPVLLV